MLYYIILYEISLKFIALIIHKIYIPDRVSGQILIYILSVGSDSLRTMNRPETRPERSLKI